MGGNEIKKIAILGASGGLGSSLSIASSKLPATTSLFLSSRKAEELECVAEKTGMNAEQITIEAADFSDTAQQDQLIETLLKWAPDRVIYCAGGGPHGQFSQKQWKDHQWALEVSFLMPARLLHRFLRQKSGDGGCQQLVFIGSAIAEGSENLLSASYGAAKTALANLIGSTCKEAAGVDIRLFSPGYMDTAMLPPNAEPRKTAGLLQPDDVAAQLLAWLDGPSTDWHMRLVGRSL